MSLLTVDQLSFSYPAGPPVLTGVTVAASRAEVIAIAGPNGAGKSTLIDLISGQKRPQSGSCKIQQKDAHSMSRNALCQLVAHVPQVLPGDIPFIVEEVILTGRVPHGRGLYENEADHAAMELAIERTRLASFRGRRYAKLSGGEKQRVLVAAALCQQAPILLLDEPSAHLDPENEAELWDLFRSLRDCGHLILVVTHHLALAAQNADRVWLLHDGKLVADGPPCDAMGPADLERIFRVPFHWHQNSEGRVFLTYGR
jgi:iron complex transport system ATP-binding protein